MRGFSNASDVAACGCVSLKRVVVFALAHRMFGSCHARYWKGARVVQENPASKQTSYASILSFGAFQVLTPSKAESFGGVHGVCLKSLSAYGEPFKIILCARGGIAEVKALVSIDVSVSLTRRYSRITSQSEQPCPALCIA